MTLVFLGSREEEEIDTLARAALGAVERLPHPSLIPAATKWLPGRAPRLVALDLFDEGGRAEQVHAAASEALARAGLHEPEGRPFWPHVTLARVRRERARAAAGRSLRCELPAAPAQPIPVERVTLYRSRPSPRGARYEALAARLLG